MILQSFTLGSIASLSMRIINSVVVVGLYYGFLTTFAIGPSYLLLFQAHIQVIEEGENEIDKEVAAETGLITGQLLMFISIYYTPLHLALARPHTITFLVIFYHLLFFYWYNSEYFYDKRTGKSIRKSLLPNPSIQSIYLMNLIYQLWNHFFFPSSMLARLVNIYMFRYNNKMLFVTSSFVGWLIGHILFMKWVKFVLVWIQKNYIVRANRYILSNEYLFYVFGFYRDFIFDLRKHMSRFSVILVFFISLCTFGRMPSPFLTYRVGEHIPQKKNVEENEEEEEKEEEKDPSTSLLELFKEACYKNKYIPTSFSGNQDISKLEIVQEEIPLSLDKPLLLSILFDYNRWNRPMRYIKNKRFEQAVRNEMSQFYFYTCQNDGKQIISFSYPPSLAIFREMIQRKISLTEKFFYDELYNDWIYAIEQKKKSLSNEFYNRIAVLDKKGLKNRNVFEKKIRLCNNNENDKEYLYLPKRYDPFLNGSYRGLIKQFFSPSIRIINETEMAIKERIPSTVILNGREIPKKKNRRFLLTEKNRIENTIFINQIQSLLGNDYNYHESEQKIDRVYKKSLSAVMSLSAEFEHFMSFIKDSLTQPIPNEGKKSIGIKEISKKVPRWPYKLFDELELLHKEADDGVEHVGDIREIPARRIILFKDTTPHPEDEENRRIVLKRYTPGPQLRPLIKGSMRAQKRKTSTWSVWQSYEHSRFFLNRIDSWFNGLIRFWYYIKGIFLNYMRKISEFELSAYYPSFEDLFISIEDSGEPKDDNRIGIRISERDAQIRAAEIKWQYMMCGPIFRYLLLITQSILRKRIILPLLIIAKNICRTLLLQRPEWTEDFEEWKKETHFICTYNGVPFSETELPESWKDEGIQIRVVHPFHLKPWHRSRPSGTDEENSFFLTTWGLPTDTPYGIPEWPEISSFFQPIIKKLYRKIKKSRAIIWIRKLLFKKRLKKRLSKNVNPNLELELREKLSEIIKEKDPIIDNQMIHESSIEAQFMNWTYLLTQKRMKDLANRRSKIRNQWDQLSKIGNLSPNKTHYGVKRLESLQNIVQILKNRTDRLIDKSEYFFPFLMEKIYVDLFIYIFNISRIYTQKFVLELTKKILDKSNYNNETNQERVDRTNKNPIQFILTIKKSHFLFSSKINKNSRSHSDLSFLSQAYVFYKLSQDQLINLYKLRSVFQYYGTSLFLKNEIKDYFRAQGIIHSELRTKKLPNSGMNQWKNWLKSHYQYGLSQRKWSKLVPQKWRKKINEYEKEQFIHSNYQNAKALLLLLPNKKENWIKNYKYEVLSYQFLFHEDKKDSYSYRIPFQGNKNKEFSYTNNYNIHKGNLIDMWWSIPITNYLNIMDIEKNKDRKYFDWKFIHFSLRKKGSIGAWIHSSNKNTKIEPTNYKIFDEFDIDDEIIDEKEKEIDKKEKKAFLDDKKDILCKKLDQTINRSNQKKNLFDWMGMNEEILSRTISMQTWLFPEFVSLYYAYKIKPWTIPINLLFSNLEDFSAKDSKTEDSKTQEKNEIFSIHDDFVSIQPKIGGCQMFWGSFVEDEDVLNALDLGVLMFHLQMKKERNLYRLVFSSMKKGSLNLDLTIEEDLTSISQLLKEGILIIEPIRLSKKNYGKLILYQTIGVSWVHKSKKHKNNQKRSRDEDNYDLLIPENLLSPRRRRELRILMCFKSRNNKGVDKNPVSCNGNRVNKDSQFFDKSKDLDRDKKKLIKFFLWPNYRLEDLACMNRYWFDTNNGSRFSILRIRMYPRFKIHL